MVLGIGIVAYSESCRDNLDPIRAAMRVSSAQRTQYRLFKEDALKSRVPNIMI